MLRRHKKGQSTLEFAILIGAVVAGLIALQIYMKRGVSGKLKSGVDEIGSQYDPVAYNSSFTTTSNSQRRETVDISRNTNSVILAGGERSQKNGYERVNAWVANEDLFNSW